MPTLNVKHIPGTKYDYEYRHHSAPVTLTRALGRAPASVAKRNRSRKACYSRPQRVPGELLEVALAWGPPEAKNCDTCVD